jgi:hypothetical protein
MRTLAPQAWNPLVDYNTGVTSGMVSGTTQPSFASGSQAPVADIAGGNADKVVAALVAVSLVTILALHILGFRFAFDVSVGRK